MSQKIETLQEIKLLVDKFYEKVRADELLGPIFKHVIEDQWLEHLEKMYRFWQTVLLKEQTYYGSPFRPHANLPVEKEHFSRWLELFTETVDEKFEGKKAEEAKWRAVKMAEMFQYKIEHQKGGNSTSLI